MECAKVCERILSFLCVFYKALAYYDPTREGGLREEGLGDLQSYVRTLQEQRLGPGGLLRELERLNEDEGIRRTLKERLGRDGIWPSRAPLDQVKTLIEERNRIAHDAVFDGLRKLEMSQSGDRESDVDSGQRLTGYVVDFLEWLLGPRTGTGGADDPHYPYSNRIYPAVVVVNVVTQTRSGIVSLRYLLRDLRDVSAGRVDRADQHAPPHQGLEHFLHDAGAGRGRSAAGRWVTVYTRQLLPVTACYYALPHPTKSRRDLWLEPLLIATDRLPVPGRMRA
jgi:hypothetical protein